MHLPVEKSHSLSQVLKGVLDPRKVQNLGCRSAAGAASSKAGEGPPNHSPGLMSPCACSAGEGPGHHQVLPVAVQAWRLGVGAELRHRRAQQPLVPAPLHRECQLCPHVSQTHLFLSLLSPSPPALIRSLPEAPSLSPSVFLELFICLLFCFTEQSGCLGRAEGFLYQH